MSSRILLGIVLTVVIIGGILSFALHWHMPISDGPIACTMEAKMCPDGSYVGRSGPNCEFAACPDVATSTPVTEGDVTLGIGQSATVAGVTITVNAFVQDSRCPIDVVCIQAGSVTVKAIFADAAHSEIKSISSNNLPPYVFDGYQISITDVAPARESQKEIANSAYRITFHVIAPKPAPVSAAKGYLVGQVTLSPTCPVEKNPPDPACAPQPYAATIDVSGAHNFFIELHAGTDGIFRIQPPPGTYTIMTRQTSLYPHCESRTVVITANATTTVNISCDSGIR